MRYKELEVKECFELRFVDLSCMCRYLLGRLYSRVSFPQKANPKSSGPKDDIPELASNDSGVDEDVASDSEIPTIAERPTVGSPFYG